MQQVRVAYSQLVVVEELLSPSKMATFGSCAAGVVFNCSAQKFGIP